MEIGKIKWNEKVTEKDYIIAILIITAIVLSYFIYVNFLPKLSFEKKYSAEVIEITGECDGCFDIAPISESLLEGGAKIKSKKTLDYNSEEAKELTEKYNIKSVPAVIILSRNIDKIKIDENVLVVNKNKGYALFDRSVPYIDINTGEIKGKINLKEIQAENCKECLSLTQLQKSLERWGVKVENYGVIPENSEIGKRLIEENDISFLPVLLIDKGIEEYWWIFPQIKESFIEQQDYYIFKTAIPPYKEIATEKIKGIVDITYLENKSCEDCFNITDLKNSFQGLGVYIDKEKQVDVSSTEGKVLLNKYNITAIPTVILSKEILDYGTVKKTLEEVGTFEKDNNFVFRKLDILNVKYQRI